MLASSLLLASLVPLVLLSRAFPQEDKRQALLAQLKGLAQRLDLLSEEQEQPGNLSYELPWKPGKVVIADVEDLSKPGMHFHKQVNADLIGASEKGQVLIVTSKAARDGNLSLTINNNQYLLIGGVAKVCRTIFIDRVAKDIEGSFSVYRAFTVGKGEILLDDFGRIRFKSHGGDCFKGSPVLRVKYGLPSSIDTSAHQETRLSSKYLIYQNVGRLESSYNIQHLSLSRKLVPKDEWEKMLGVENINDAATGQINVEMREQLTMQYCGLVRDQAIEHVAAFFHELDVEQINNVEKELLVRALITDHWGDRVFEKLISNMRKLIVGQAISLIRFIQLWDAVKKGYGFENSALKEIQAELGALRDATTDEKKALLLKACNFIWPKARDRKGDIFPFLSILMEQEPLMRDSIFFGRKVPLESKLQLDRDVCDKLSGKLMFFTRHIYNHQSFPLWLTLPCVDEPERAGDQLVMEATFRLVAQINGNGRMFTFGSDYVDSVGEEMVKIASYGAEPQVEVDNAFIADPHKFTLALLEGVLIYQHVRTEEHDEATEPAASQ